MFLMWLENTTLNPKGLFHGEREYSLVRKNLGYFRDQSLEILILPLTSSATLELPL